MHSEFEGVRAVNSPRQLSGRGLSYWTDGKEERIIYVTTAYKMIALDAKTGNRVPSFGKDGYIDLKVGLVHGTNEQIDLETGDAGYHGAPLVVKDTIVVGVAMKEGMTVKTHNNTKGQARAYDVRTGKLIWAFNTIPKQGEFGNETWENNSWATNGNTGVWTQITVDEDLGLVYSARRNSDVGFLWRSPARKQSICREPGLRGFEDRPAQVAFPIYSSPDLGSRYFLGAAHCGCRRGRQAEKVVAVPTKQSMLYVFDRVTGTPIWPIPEVPVPQSDVPGEKTAATQPIPSKPPAYARTYVKVPDDVIDFLPEMRAQGLTNLERYKVVQSPYVPYVVGNERTVGALNIGNTGGGTNWPGGGYDPETHIVYAQASNTGLTTGTLRTPPAGFSDIRYVSGREGTTFTVSEGPGFGSAADYPTQPQRGGRGGAGAAAEGNRGAAPAGGAAAPAAAAAPTGNLLQIEGLSILKPPYGVLSAINLDRGDLLWSVPHGDTPDAVRNHPKVGPILADYLRRNNLPKTGQSGSVGLIVTKTLVILGDPAITTTPEHPRGAMLRAYDKATGKEVGAVHMPAQQSGSPMTYSVNGRQYIVVAISGGNYSGEYIAFRLPSEVTTAAPR